MIMSFPVLVSKTVDTEILPFLLKVIERKYAIEYIPTLKKMIEKELGKYAHIKSNVIEGIILEEEELDKRKLMESDMYGIQVIMSDSNKLNSDQPYFITLRIITPERVTHDYVFGFKTLSLVTTEALKIFAGELDDSRYLMHRFARRLFGEEFVWKMTKWYLKVFYREYAKKEEYETRKILFSERRERLAILSVHDLTKEEFELADADDQVLSAANLEKSRWAFLYIDDPLNKKVYVWDQKMPRFSNVITYDMLHKEVLGILPEQIDKAKQRNASLFSRRVPRSWATKKVLGQE